MQRIFLISALIPLLGACATTHELIKDVESKNYTALAKAFDRYCGLKNRNGALGVIAKQEALELRREIRQRGTENGPQGPAEKPPFLDDQTAYGRGAVVRVYCDGDRVPAAVWEDFTLVKEE